MAVSSFPWRISFLRATLWALFALSAAAHYHPHRRVDLYERDRRASASSFTVATSSASRSSVSSSSFSHQSASSSGKPSSSDTSLSSAAASTATSSSLTLVTTTTRSSTSSTSTSSSNRSTSSSRNIGSSPLPSTSSSASPLASVSSAFQTNGIVPPTTASTSTSALDAPPDIATATESDEPTTTASAAKSNINATSKGFWGNKSAVGGTFAAVSLTAVGVLVLAWILRKRANSRNSARDTFFDTKNLTGPERYSANPSIVSLGNPPMDAHATPVPSYGLADQYLVDADDHGISYPPGSFHNPAAQQYYAQPAAADQQLESGNYHADQNAYDTYNQLYSGGDGSRNDMPGTQRSSLSPHPSNVPPPSAIHDFAARDSYQPSIDSFYGAPGTAL